MRETYLVFIFQCVYAKSAFTYYYFQLSNVENSPTSDHVTGSGNYSVPSRPSAAGSAVQSSTPQAVLDMNKQSDGHSYTQNSTYNSYQSKSYNTTYNASQVSVPLDQVHFKL